jgi:hypothetical protein
MRGDTLGLAVEQNGSLADSMQVDKLFSTQAHIFNAPAVQNIEDYRPGPILLLAITQLQTLAPAQQKRLLSRWCALLPTLKEVKHLGFCSRVTQEMFDAACSMPNLEQLYVKWSAIVHIRELPKAKKLRCLRIGASSKLEGIEELAEMRNLIWLNLEQFNKIDDFTPVSGLVQLEYLGIDGSIWTQQRLRSLKPLAGLTELRLLTLLNTRAADNSFDPLLGLHKLERFDCSWNYPEAEFAKLKRLPNLKHGNVQTTWKEVRQKLRQDSGNS